MPDAVLAIMPPIYRADREGNLAHRNAAFDQLAGAAFPEFRNSSRAKMEALPAPAELVDIFDRLNAGEENVKLRQSYNIEGHVRHFRSSHFRLFDNGEPAGMPGSIPT